MDFIVVKIGIENMTSSQVDAYVASIKDSFRLIQESRMIYLKVRDMVGLDVFVMPVRLP